MIGIQIPSWPASGSACLLDDGGACNGQGVCVPAPPPNAVGPCIGRDGDVACPASYPDKRLLYDGAYQDGRGCTTCSCGSPVGSSCQCTGGNCGIGVHGQANCQGGLLGFIPVGGNCGSFTTNSNTVGVILVGAQVSSAGVCPAAITQPTGSVTPTGPITVCCVP
jgi:hypothetical protein